MEGYWIPANLIGFGAIIAAIVFAWDHSEYMTTLLDEKGFVDQHPGAWDQISDRSPEFLRNLKPNLENAELISSGGKVAAGMSTSIGLGIGLKNLSRQFGRTEKFANQ